jgi:hypothetical protein
MFEDKFNKEGRKKVPAGNNNFRIYVPEPKNVGKK